jgi:hypothetical protein
MAGDITFDVGGAYPFVEQRVLQIFGKDTATIEETQWLRMLHGTAAQIVSRVQCVGMATPIPFEDIYQPTHLYRRGIRNKVAESFTYGDRTERSFANAEAQKFRKIPFDDLIDIDDDGFIYAGPGWGKSTFLSSVFRVQLRNDDVWPVMIFLRRPNAVADLEHIVSIATKIKKKAGRSREGLHRRPI